MRRLILLRHARAEPRSGAGGDLARPLAARGREDAALVGQALAREHLAPDLVLLSPAQRATETWSAARDALPEAKVELVRELYNAAPHAIRAAIRGAAGQAETLMVVGHNPGLHEVAVALLVENSAAAADVAKVAAGFPTATAALFEIDAAGRASFDGLILARDQGGEGGG
ncbi:MAG TPA: histidine phosphatase family protein [Caulobacteraceae bacterium]|nr:histidine phosphatase family protein [Caulobacteraceae bacterium]